jgi:hypothetical protein
MKHIIKYLSALLTVVLIGTTFTACSEDDDNGSANIGLGIKAFFPTKVVTNQPITINGSGFNDVKEIEFPGGTKVTNFEIVSNDMIRVNAPAGIPADGGKIIVRTTSDQAESRMPLTLGHTLVTGFSKQEGETAAGGELITVYGTDLEFINGVELLDPDSVPQIIDHKDFYRKGTSTLIFRVPPKNIYKGTFQGALHTYDGQNILMPLLAYEPAADEGHMEIVKTTIWKNDGSAGPISWSGQCRFALEGHDGNNECIAEFPQDVWDKIKTQTFYITITSADPQVRVTTGWWDPNWKVGDIQPGNELLTDNGDGTFTVEINLSDDPDFVAALDDRHLLFTGDRYTLDEIYFSEEVWVDGPGQQEVKTYVWQNDGSAAAMSWSGQCRFALEGHDGNSECIAEIPEDLWQRLKTETFYITVEATDPQVRVTTGWWDPSWKVGDIQPGNELLTDNGDGTFTVTINLSDDPDFVAALDDRHLLFTGDRYTLKDIYFIDYVSGGGGAKEDVFWQGDSSAGAVSWSGAYRFALEGHDGNNECLAEFPQDVWDKIKTTTFYLVVESADPQIRVTTGWWDPNWVVGDLQPGNELLTDNGDGTWTAKINISDDADFVNALDDRHLLFTGDRFTPLKLYFLE